jgi:NADH dehydrogenase [ubiquinone] 1 alpha subcomplex assembly factor 7
VPSEPLKDLLAARIHASGPLNLASYMQEALTHPEHGYYTTRNSIGAKGDFTTAPEISQLFGELIGLWIVDCWHQMGAPETINVIEPGPGRGTLMADALRAIRQVSTMKPAIHLIEVSPRLIALQKELIAPQKEPIDATWHSSFDTVPPGPFILVGNEFFDALPIHQFEKTTDGWAEVVVGMDTKNNRLQRELVPCPTPILVAGPATIEGAPVGSIVETCPAAESIIADISARLAKHGGAALFIDYGYSAPAFGGSLQALYQGQYADPFENPGQADLTAHVNFSALATIAEDAGLARFGPTTQSQFLDRLGLPVRAASLKKNATPDQARDIDLAVHRLMAPDQMGELFKALAIAPAGRLHPAGFAA